MPDPQLLKFSVDGYTADQLTLKVQNTSGASLDKGMTIELRPVAYLLDQRIKDAAREAATNPQLPGVKSLSGIVSGPSGWTVWAMRESTDNIVFIMLVNDRNEAGQEIPPTKLDPAAEFTIRIPLNRQASRATVDLPYSYQYDIDDRVDDKLELKSAEAPDWAPDVTLTTDEKSPTMIEPMKDVKIFWHIKDGVSATLRGPLPGGNSEWTLSNSTSSDYKLSDGWFQIKATGAVTYILQAEVKRSDGQPNVKVVKVLSLDVYTKGKYGYVDARPQRVLPFGLVEIDWAAWGADKVTLEAGSVSRTIPLTDMTLSGFRQGAGVMRLNAGKPESDKQPLETSIDLIMEIKGVKKREADTRFKVIPWRKMLKSDFTGQPVGLAVAAPHLALLTTDGLWTANVGNDDFTPISYDQIDKVSFNHATKTEKPKAWLALAALEFSAVDKKFVVLRQTSQDDLQVALYNASDGKPYEIAPVDLPADLRPLMAGGGRTFDLVVLDGRAYVVVESSLAGGTVRRAFSVRFDSQTKKAEFRSEPVLESLAGYRLLIFDDALHALNRLSGHMFRFELKDGKLDQSYRAASASQQNSSMVKQGVFVPVGRVLAVLSPSAVPSLASLEVFGLKNVLSYKTLSPPKDPGTLPQDLVYNPQNNRWVRCGHGLDVEAGVVAFRPGDSPRLWFIEPNGNTYTLTVSSEHLFSHDYVTDLPSRPLLPFFNKKRQFQITNNVPMQFVRMDDACRKVGLVDFSSTAPAEIISPPNNLPPGTTQTFELRYNESDPGEITLRLLIQRAPGAKLDYFLEVTFYGADLSKATTVFKRVAVNAPGGASIAEVPGTREQHSTTGPITFFPKPLINEIRLEVRNASPYKLWLRRPEAPEPRDRENEYLGGPIMIKYNTPPISIYAHGAGELHFDVDFGQPPGFEVSPGTVGQKKRIRINPDASTGLNADSFSVQETPEYDAYECTARYKRQRDLEFVYLGDGVPDKEGTSIFLPLANPPSADKVQIMKIDANSLVPVASVGLQGGGVFAAPNCVAVSKDKVLAILKNTYLSYFDHSLKPIKTVELIQYDVVTNLKASPNDLRMQVLGMKQQNSGAFKYSYTFGERSFDPNFNVERDIVLDLQKGFTPGRVPGAPAWVSPSTTSPMDVISGFAVAVCVEGGLFLIDLKSKKVMEVGINGTGREEAVVIDPVEPLIFCAHAKPDTHGLMISRINPSNPSDRQTITLPSTVTHMVTDTNPFVGPNLRYNRPRAVSLAVTSDTVFVSHSRKIYALDKKRLTERRQIELDLPCRLIQVRRQKAPGEAHQKYGTPRDCYMVWAIGSLYIGGGQDLAKFRTALYKLGIVL